MNSLTDQQLLRDYAGSRSESAFAELVRRHVDLVYSAALRMVRDTHLAEDVTQRAFAALAQNARHLTDRPVLSGWLHRTAQNLAANAVRSEVRRRAREQEASAMNEVLATGSDATWEHIAPHLDAALGELNEADRDAVLLRYFERKSAREMAQVLGVSDEAAQKRVTRAVDHLREFFAKRGVGVGASGCVALISANAVQAAPAGLMATIATAALAGTVSTSTAIATTKTIAMTTIQKTLVTVTVAVLAGAGIFEARQTAKLRTQNQLLQQQQAPLADQIQQLQRERDNATNRLASLAGEIAQLKTTQKQAELLKLRGEVGTLRQEKKMIGEKSALNKITSDPASRKFMREQQKTAMNLLYGDFTKHLNLTPEMSGQFSDLLADNAMDTIDLITQALHDGNSPAEVERIFSAADTAFEGKVQALLGDDALAQYKDYNQNLAGALTAAMFATTLTGDAATKQDKQNQLKQVMQAETAAALKNAGLPANYQVLPMLNLANAASEDLANRNLNLLDGIYANVAANSSSFLTPEELARFQTFRTNSLNQSLTILNMNRKLMAPIVK